VCANIYRYMTVFLFNSLMRFGKYLSYVMKVHFYKHRALVFGSMFTTNTNDFHKQLYPTGIANGDELFYKEITNWSFRYILDEGAENIVNSVAAFEQNQDGTAVPSWFCWSCSKSVYKPVWHIPLLSVQWITPDDGQRNCPKHADFHFQNEFEKLVHLVGFIVRKHYLGVCLAGLQKTTINLISLCLGRDSNCYYPIKFRSSASRGKASEFG
jgi:hypothetical protein